MRRMLVLAMLAALVAGAVAESASAVVPARTIRSADGRLIMKIPRGALRKNVPITIRILRPGQIPSGLQPKVTRIGKIYEIKPNGLRFLKPVTIIRRFPRFDFSDGMPAIWLVSRSRRGRLEFLRAQKVTREGGTAVARGTTLHLSSFASYDSGVHVDLTPEYVDTAVGQNWGANVEATDEPGLSVDTSVYWEAKGAVGHGAGTAPPPSDSPDAVFYCKEVGDGDFDAEVKVTEDPSYAWNIAGQFLFPNATLKSFTVYLDGDANCRDPAAAPVCAEPPRAAPTTHNGEPKVQVTAGCAGMLQAGLDNANVSGSPAQITEYNAHSTSCTFEGAGVSVTCKVKPDGRICMILKFNPPLTPGAIVRVQLAKVDGTPLFVQNLTVGANGEANCSTGP